MCLIHDNGEARVGDQHKLAARYFDIEKAEHDAFNDQLELAGDEIKEKWQKYFNEFENRNTREGVIAKDADWLEQAFQAKEYAEIGFESVQVWVENVEQAMETESAKKLLREMKNIKFTDWFKGLKKMTYKKL